MIKISMVPIPTILLRFKQQCRYQLMAIFIFSVASNLLFLMFPLYSMQVFNRVLNTGSVHTLLWLIVIVMLCMAVSSLLNTTRAFCLSNIASWAGRKLREEIIDILSACAPSRDRQAATAQSMRDIETIKSTINGGCVAALFDMPWGIMYLLLLFFIHPLLGGLSLAGLVLLTLLAFSNVLLIRRYTTPLNSQTLETLQHIERSMQSAEAVQSMGLMSALGRKWKQGFETADTLQTHLHYRLQVLEKFTQFLRIGLQVLSMGLAAYLAVQRDLTSGAIIASSMFSSRVLAPFDALFTQWSRLSEAYKAYLRIVQVLSAPVQTDPGMKLAAPTQGNLSVEGVVYGVKALTSQAILKGVSFQANPGEILAITGPVGSGKTTLARVILGILSPVAGSVRFDNMDITHYNRTVLGTAIGYVPQNVQLIPGSVRDNIARLQEVGDEAVVEAAVMAGMSDMLLQLPDGYNTLADTLSAGQAQLVALARAFFNIPRLLVLDEPDSHQDADGEQKLITALKNVREKKITTIIITHRMSILRNVDRVIVLKGGRIDRILSVQEMMHPPPTTPAERQG